MDFDGENLGWDGEEIDLNDDECKDFEMNKDKVRTDDYDENELTWT